MVQVVPLSPVAFQALEVPLSGHVLTLQLQQRGTGLYLSLSRDGVGLIAGLLCQDRTWLVRKSYFGLPGDLVFVATQATPAPHWLALGTPFVLMYKEASPLTHLGPHEAGENI